MQEVIISVGVSGSGKTTWATNLLEKNLSFIRINRDTIRTMLAGNLFKYYERKDIGKIEELVTTIEESTFISALQAGRNIIIDNTNLKPTHINKWEALIKSVLPEYVHKVKFKIKLFTENNVAGLKNRVFLRDSYLSWKELEYIEKQVKQLEELEKHLQKHPKYHFYE